jgi:hypothetical protein
LNGAAKIDGDVGLAVRPEVLDAHHEKRGLLILCRAEFTRLTRRFRHVRIRILKAFKCHLIHSSFNGSGAHTMRPLAVALRELSESNVQRRESF